MTHANRNRNLRISVAGVLLLAALGLGQAALERTAAAQAGVEAPMFEVDPLWPKPLPNHWILGSTIGVTVDDQDHIWIIHRGDSLSAGEVPAAQDPPNAAECCFPAPPVLGSAKVIPSSVWKTSFSRAATSSRISMKSGSR